MLINPTKKIVDELSNELISAAVYVHQEAGPCLVKSVYDLLYSEELRYRKLSFSTQQKIPIQFRKQTLMINLQTDFIVEELLLVELRSTQELHPVDDAMIISYLQLLKKPKGLLFNFCSTNIIEGMKSYQTPSYHDLPLG